MQRDTTITKIDSSTSPRNPEGMRYLASGKAISMRIWEHEKPGIDKSPSRRDYETVGYVIDGRAELHIEGQTVVLERGNSWVVPRGAEHHYKIVEPFTAVEATTPPFQVHGRDEDLGE